MKTIQIFLSVSIGFVMSACSSDTLNHFFGVDP